MSAQIETAIIRGGGKVEFDVGKRMEGGMKHVYFTRDRSAVVAFFHNSNQDFQRADRLSKVVNQFNPTKDGQANAAYWRDLFCWPTHLVDHSAYGIGILLPAYPNCFFFTAGQLKGQEKDGGWLNCIDRKTNRVMRYSKVDPSERGNLQTYLAALIRVARAVQRMHLAGLAHADLSERNVLLDPSTGRAIIIDVDALVVTGLYPPDVLGTPGYIAPEVMATKHLKIEDPNRRHACAETDRYALSVMIHKYLLERHPLEGGRVLKGLTAEQEDEALFGSKALYSEHRTDSSNRPKQPDYLRAAFLGKKIEDLFHRNFVDGLLSPGKRPTPGEWVTALCEAFDMLLACPNPSCTHRMFVLTDAGSPSCPYCRTRYRGTFSVMKLTHEERGHLRNEGEMVLNGFRGGTGTVLYRFHTHRGAPRGPGQDSTPLAQVVFMDKPTPTFYLQNLALPSMKVRNPSGGTSNFQPLPMNAKLQLTSGLEVQFGDEPEARRGTVATHHR
jgi:serine/threonine protein kinase